MVRIGEGTTYSSISKWLCNASMTVSRVIPAGRAVMVVKTVCFDIGSSSKPSMGLNRKRLRVGRLLYTLIIGKWESTVTSLFIA